MVLIWNGWEIGKSSGYLLPDRNDQTNMIATEHQWKMSLKIQG